MDLWESYFGAVRSGNWKKAVEILESLSEKEPENPQVFLKLGDGRQKLGDPERAVPAYMQAAHLLLKEGFLQKALAVYKIILRLDPHNHEALNRSRDLLVEIEASRLKTVASETIVPEEEQVTEPLSSPPSMEEVIIRTSYEEQKTPPVIPEFLRGLPEREIKSIMEGLKTINFSAGDIIVEEGDSGDSIYVIKSGRVKVTTHVLGKVVELAILGRGDIFGEVAFLTGRPRTATVTAIEPVEVFEFTRPVLESLLERYPELLKILQDFYYSRLQNTLRKAKGAT